MSVFKLTSLMFVLLTSATAIFSQQVTVEPVSYTTPVVSISGDTPILRNCGQATTPAVVNLTARTTLENTAQTRYIWTTDAGRIEGNGPTATWVLDGVAPGSYRAYLETVTGTTKVDCQAFASTTVLVECPPVPECPKVTVICPDRVDSSAPLRFGSLVSGAVGGLPLVYTWTVNTGTIISGQGTDSITVSPTGLEGQTITATVALGFDLARCSANCAAQIPVRQTCRKFDEYPEISRNEEKARLDNFGIELQNDPFATAYVVIHPTASGKAGEIDERRREVLDYLVNARGLDGKRIRIQVGSAAAALFIEIWLCPRGVTLP
jgi:hypothetical protein